MTSRRRFLEIIFAGLGLTTLASFLYPLFRYLSPRAEDTEAQRLVLSKNEIPAGDAKQIVFRNIPGIVVNRPDKGFIAFSRVCTHLGCLIDFQKDRQRFLCPCHAGTFDLAGNVTSGPPPQPLQQLPLKVEGDSIVIG